MQITEKLSLLSQALSKVWAQDILRGMEKEHLRVDGNGHIAFSPHPEAFGSPLMHSLITTDFSEALLELVTPPVKGFTTFYQAMEQLTIWVNQQLPQELLWVGSMPGWVPSPQAIPIAQYGTSNKAKMKEIYRKGLALRYGKMMQIIAGIHYNISFPDSLFEALQSIEGKGSLQFENYRSQKYMALIRRFACVSWLVPYLFGVTPACTVQSAAKAGLPILQPWQRYSCFAPQATSLRYSEMGYRNPANLRLEISLASVTDYAKSLIAATEQPYAPFVHMGLKDAHNEYQQLNTCALQIENEYYSAIRPKQTPRAGERPAMALAKRGVAYLEVRLLDLDPTYLAGQPKETFRFIDILLLYSLLHEIDAFSLSSCHWANQAFAKVVLQGRDLDLLLPKAEDHPVRLQDEALRLLDILEPLAVWLDQSGDSPEADYQRSLAYQRAKVSDVSLTPSAQLQVALLDSGLEYHDFMFALSESLQRTAAAKPKDLAYEEQMQRAAEFSQSQQQALESQPQQPFVDFLKDYYRGQPQVHSARG